MGTGNTASLAVKHTVMHAHASQHNSSLSSRVSRLPTIVSFDLGRGWSVGLHSCLVSVLRNSGQESESSFSYYFSSVSSDTVERGRAHYALLSPLTDVRALSLNW